MGVQRKKYIILLLTIVCIMTIGFAVLSSSLTINGQTSFGTNTWNVKFQNIVLDSSNNVTATTTPSISDNTSITFSVALSKPGDKYSFTVDVVNTGSIDAMINTINKSSLTTDQSKYLDYTVTYIDGVAIQEKDKLLKTNGSETILVTINYKTDVTAEDLPSSADTLNLTFSLNYVQDDGTGITVSHTPLQNFILKAKAGNATSSDVGTEFTVNLGDTYGEHTLRVANVSTPSECSNEGFSQTACGVVLEFVDIITTHVMNETDTNVGGWPATSMRTFVNEDIYNALPPNLKSAIIDTTVVSGHGTNDSNNFTSTDKLYLLSTHEVWVDESSNQISDKETSYNNTRQLDYYARENVTISSYSSARKIRIVIKDAWWLRSTRNTNATSFLGVDYSGRWNSYYAANITGVSPAFRIS